MLIAPTPPAKRNDPETSHISAAAIAVSHQAQSLSLALLRVFAGGGRFTDDEAIELANHPGTYQRRRLSDLRKHGLIKPVTLNGRLVKRRGNHRVPVMQCRITEAGLEKLKEANE